MVFSYSGCIENQQVCDHIHYEGKNPYNYSIPPPAISGLILESEVLLGLIFITIIVTVILIGIFARFIAKKTGVIPMEILIVGGGGVGRMQKN